MKITILILATILVLSCNQRNTNQKSGYSTDNAIHIQDSLDKLQYGKSDSIRRDRAGIEKENNRPVADFGKLEMNRLNDTIEYRYNLGTNISGADELEYLLSEYALNVVPPDTNYSVVKHVVMISINRKPAYRKYVYICKSGTLSFDLKNLDCSKK